MSEAGDVGPDYLEQADDGTSFASVNTVLVAGTKPAR